MDIAEKAEARVAELVKELVEKEQFIAADGELIRRLAAERDALKNENTSHWVVRGEYRKERDALKARVAEAEKDRDWWKARAQERQDYVPKEGGGRESGGHAGSHPVPVARGSVSAAACPAAQFERKEGKLTCKLCEMSPPNHLLGVNGSVFYCRNPGAKA